MPRAFKLTWDKANKSWLKYYKGRRHYLGTGSGKYDRDSYEAALFLWTELKQKIDTGDAIEAKSANRDISRKEVEKLFKGLLSESSTGNPFPRHSIAWCVTEYAASEYKRVEDGKIGYGYYRQVLWALRVFVKEFCERKKAITGYVYDKKSGISTQRLMGFRKFLERKRREGVYKDPTINRLLSAVRLFTKWCVIHDHLNEVPVGFKAHTSPLGTTIRGRHTHEDVYVPDLETLHLVLEFYRDRALQGDFSALCMLTYFVLMLNVGATPVDLAWITNAEWDSALHNENHLFLRRTKTGVPGNFLLWKDTVKLVEHIRANKDGEPIELYSPYHGELVELLFKTPRGKALTVGSSTKKIGKTAYNGISAKWYRERKQCAQLGGSAVSRFVVKHLRKIGADSIAKREGLDNRLELVSLYLRHSHGTMASKHYIQRHDRILDSVLVQLYSDLEIKNILAPVLHELDAGNLVQRPVPRRRSRGG